MRLCRYIQYTTYNKRLWVWVILSWDMTSESLGGVTHARQRSIRDKRHRRDCERVAQQLLGKLNISQKPILIIQTSSKSFIFFYPCWVNGNFINSASYLEQSHFPTPCCKRKYVCCISPKCTPLKNEFSKPYFYCRLSAVNGFSTLRQRFCVPLYYL